MTHRLRTADFLANIDLEIVAGAPTELDDCCPCSLCGFYDMRLFFWDMYILIFIDWYRSFPGLADNGHLDSRNEIWLLTSCVFINGFYNTWENSELMSAGAHLLFLVGQTQHCVHFSSLFGLFHLNAWPSNLHSDLVWNKRYYITYDFRGGSPSISKHLCVWN